jgi:hypothetical protein
MNATYTVRYTGYAATAELEKVTAWMKELPRAAKAALMLVAGPLVGLAFVIVLPFAGLVLAAWMAVKTAARRWTGAALIVKRVALFAAAPFVGLAYLIAFPFVGIGALAYYGIRAARK